MCDGGYTYSYVANNLFCHKEPGHLPLEHVFPVTRVSLRCVTSTLEHVFPVHKVSLRCVTSTLEHVFPVHRVSLRCVTSTLEHVFLVTRVSLRCVTSTLEHVFPVTRMSLWCIYVMFSWCFLFFKFLNSTKLKIGVSQMFTIRKIHKLWLC